MIKNMTNFASVVDVVKSSLESELSPTAYNLWIAPLKAIELRDSDVVLSLSNEFQKDIIMTKYSHMLCKSSRG